MIFPKVGRNRPKSVSETLKFEMQEAENLFHDEFLLNRLLRTMTHGCQTY